ncbi:MAG TPA: EAL domain-containing protein [Thermoleophilaceae bacterium]|nr:EAL domain-containing protein [Thermoleophilaceae bacterium]
MGRKLGFAIAHAARRRAFVLRLVLALVASVALMMVASQMFFTRAASRELVQQDARSYAADATALETAYIEGDDPYDAMDDVLDLVDSMEDRLGIVSAQLLNARGKPVTAPRDSDLDTPPVQSGRARRWRNDDVETSRSGANYDFLADVHLGKRPFVLKVQASGKVLHSRISALRDETLAFSTIVLLLAMALFYLVGGRSFARRHRSVVKRATRDPLTDLGNHRSFQQELERAVAGAMRRSESLAVALVDLDDFKLVNDRHGHRHGDEVLSHIARVLADGRPDDRAFRIGGDEFALLLPGADSLGASTALARRLDDARKGPNAVSFTAGVAVMAAGAPGEGGVLWEHADAALYEGKRRGGGQTTVFDDVADLLSVVTPAKIHALRALLDDPQIEIVFQPIWDLQNYCILGVEALARPWSGYGFDGPAEMFAIAEKIGRAHELDTVCRSAALARAPELPADALLFLNVNPQSLAHDSLAGVQLVDAVKAVGLVPERVVLEITERSNARLDHVVADATRLRGLGFQLALDDVGAGNAGLEMLRELAVDYMKIDRSVIAAAVEDTHAQAVLVAILAYARRTAAFVIAEGIESMEILEFVRNAADLQIVGESPISGGQGYLLGRPSSDPSPSAHLETLAA